MELSVILLFIACLLACVITGLSILYALLAGFLLFSFYSMKKGFSLNDTLHMAVKGVLTVKNILLTFILIGMLTGIWRISGTLPEIVCLSVKLIHPAIFVLLAFLLNAMLSFLTGTSFGTCATIGAICMIIARTLGMNEAVMGGAILAGAFFGDRCSPVSTSAILVAELTGTDIYRNIREMLKTALVPFILSCIIYLVLGWILPHGDGAMLDVQSIFSTEFNLNPWQLLPALVILALAIAKVSVKKTLFAGIVAAFVIGLLTQSCGALAMIKTMILGYYTQDPQLSAMINGGGIKSMLRVAAIVCLSSSYSGIFEKTGLLDSLKTSIAGLSQKLPPFAVILPTAIITGAISCNQTLTIILTHQLCTSAEKDPQKLAINIEDSAVIISPLIPWSIAGAVPLAIINAPTLSLAAACYLYLIPLWGLIMAFRGNAMRKQ